MLQGSCSFLSLPNFVSIGSEAKEGEAGAFEHGGETAPRWERMFGVYKTAVVAMGIPDRTLARALADGNAIAFSGITDKRFQQANLAFASQALGMQTPGTSYTSATPSLKDQKGLVKELGQRMLVDQLAANMSAEEKAVLNAMIRGQVSKIDQKKADQKAQTAAIRSTAITLATLGVGATVKGGAGSLLDTYFRGSKALLQATVSTVLQTVDGSRNGIQGMFAGFANGAIGILTAGGKLDIPGAVRDVSGQLTKGSTLGLGVTFNKEDGWGGMVGIGGAAANLNVSFSQGGNTTVSGSVQDPNRPSIQFTGTTTTNGSTTVGVNYNPTGKGPRQGSNFGANYDTTTGQGSVNAGYTDTTTGIGFLTTVDADGVSTSTQYNGVNIATIDENGFTYDEMNWAEQNINNAQNRTDEMRLAIAGLKREGLTDAEIRSMTHEERVAAMEAYTRGHENQIFRDNGLMDSEIANLTEQERSALLEEIENSQTNTETGAAATAGTSLLSIIGAYVLGRRRESPIPTDAPVVGNTTNEQWAHPPESGPDKPGTPINNGLFGKSLKEVKAHLETLSTTELNMLARDGKKSNLADFTKSDLVIQKSDVINYRDKIVEPAKESQVKALNERINALLGGKLLTDVSTASLIHDMTSDVSGATYNDAIARAQALRLSANGFTDIATSFPVLNQVREAMIQGSESNATTSTNRYINTVMPTAEQLRVAEKRYKDFQDGNLTKLDDKTATVLAKALILDADFAKLAQPQKLKDSYEKLMKAKEGYNVLVDKITRGELNQSQVKLELATLDAVHKKALAEHESNWKSYESDVAKMIQGRGTDGSVKLAQLAKISTDLIVDGPILEKTVTANYRVYQDKSGNSIVVASGDAIRLERASQQNDFQNAIKEASARPDGIPSQIKIDPVSGVIQTGLDGKKLTMSPIDTTRRKETYEAVRTALGNSYLPDNNPNFAKMEAMRNFDVDKSSGRNFTTVNGVRFDFELRNDVSPEKSIVEADGANWLKLSNVANELNISNIGLNSVVRYDSYSHKDGYSLDVGSITVGTEVIPISHSNGDFEKGVVPPTPMAPLDQFLEQISGSESNSFSYNPYYMVDGNGNKTPNFFTATPKDEWKNGKDWDGAKTGLSPAQRTQFSKLMRDMASKNDPPYQLSDENIKQMWNHRHHLHVTEISK